MNYPETPDHHDDQPERLKLPYRPEDLVHIPFAVGLIGDLIELNEQNEPVLSRTEKALQASQDLLTKLKVDRQEMAILGTDGNIWTLRSDMDHDSLDLRDHPTGSWTVSGPEFKAQVIRSEAEYPGGPKHRVVVSAHEPRIGQIAEAPTEEHIAAAVLYAQTKVLEQEQSADTSRRNAGSRIGRLLNRRA